MRSCTSPAGLGVPRIMFGEKRPSDLLHKLAQAFFKLVHLLTFTIRTHSVLNVSTLQAINKFLFIDTRFKYTVHPLFLNTVDIAINRS